MARTNRLQVNPQKQKPWRRPAKSHKVKVRRRRRMVRFWQSRLLLNWTAVSWRPGWSTPLWYAWYRRNKEGKLCLGRQTAGQKGRRLVWRVFDHSARAAIQWPSASSSSSETRCGVHAGLVLFPFIASILFFFRHLEAKIIPRWIFWRDQRYPPTYSSMIIFGLSVWETSCYSRLSDITKNNFVKNYPLNSPPQVKTFFSFQY